MKFLLIVMSLTFAFSASASTGLNCGKQILTSTDTDYEWSTGGDDDSPSGSLTNPKTYWNLSVAGKNVKEGTTVKTITHRANRDIVMTQTFKSQSGAEIQRVYSVLGISDAVCDGTMQIQATIVETSSNPKVAPTTQDYLCECDVD